MNNTDIYTATARLHNVSKILGELNTEIFSFTFEGISTKDGIGRDRREKALENCYDWMCLNYNLVATVINEMSYVCEDMTRAVERYVLENEPELEKE